MYNFFDNFYAGISADFFWGGYGVYPGPMFSVAVNRKNLIHRFSGMYLPYSDGFGVIRYDLGINNFQAGLVGVYCLSNQKLSLGLSGGGLAFLSGKSSENKALLFSLEVGGYYDFGRE